MTQSRFATLLHEQVGQQFHASKQYIAIAVDFDSGGVQQLAARFYKQALEEGATRLIVQYLMDAGLEVKVPAIPAPHTSFDGIAAPVRWRCAGAARLEQISEIALAARAEGDLQSEQFMQWFLKEQVEEVATMSTLLRVIERAGDNVLAVEDYLARQPAPEGSDPTAPSAAGGSVA